MEKLEEVPNANNHAIINPPPTPLFNKAEFFAMLCIYKYITNSIKKTNENP